MANPKELIYFCKTIGSNTITEAIFGLLVFSNLADPLPVQIINYLYRNYRKYSRKHYSNQSGGHREEVCGLNGADTQHF